MSTYLMAAQDEKKVKTFYKTVSKSNVSLRKLLFYTLSRYLELNPFSIELAMCALVKTKLTYGRVFEIMRTYIEKYV